MPRPCLSPPFASRFRPQLCSARAVRELDTLEDDLTGEGGAAGASRASFAQKRAGEAASSNPL